MAVTDFDTSPDLGAAMPPFVLRDFQRRVQKYGRAADVPRGRFFSRQSGDLVE
jgi:hypothetical protein